MRVNFTEASLSNLNPLPPSPTLFHLLHQDFLLVALRQCNDSFQMSTPSPGYTEVGSLNAPGMFQMVYPPIDMVAVDLVM